MDLEALQSGSQTGWVAALIRGVLLALSQGYRAGRTLHRGLFRCGLLRAARLPVPVVSVGNLTAGGVGKTPFVAWLSRQLMASGWQPAVLARGYGRAPGEVLNDEGRWLVQEVAGLPVLQDPDRAGAARQHLASHRCDVFVLDDGFQHERLQRDLDVVLVDATRPFGYGYLLPRGLLREPHSALRRADVIIVTRLEQVTEVQREALETELRRLAPDRLVLGSRFHIRELHRGREVLPAEWLAGRAVLLLAGIGHPAGVRQTVTSLGALVKEEAFFADHHHYTAADWQQLQGRCRERSLELVTTTKDEVKLAPLRGADDLNPLVLHQELELLDPEQEFRRRLHQLLGKPEPA